MATQQTGSLAVEVSGAGDPLVMIHGLGGSSNVFTPQAGVLGRWFQLIRPDLPGAGRTPVGAERTLEAYADAVLALMDSLGVERAHVAGHSLGTVVCQQLAVRHPERVRSLALIGPLVAPAEAGRKGMRERAAKVRSEGMVSIADAIVQGGTSVETRAHRPEVAAFVRELIMRQDAEGYALMCEALAAVEGAPIERIGCPTLLLTGDEDGTSPPRAVRAMADRIPGARMHVFGRCGHWTTLERPGEVSEALSNFYMGL